MSRMPRSSPASDTLVIPKVRRYAFQRSASFFLRIKRFKFKPQTTSFDCVKFSVVNGISIVAVHPSAVLRASEVHTPSHPRSKSPPFVSPCSSTMRPSTCVPRGLTSKTYAPRRSWFESIRISKWSSKSWLTSRRSSVAMIREAESQNNESRNIRRGA